MKRRQKQSKTDKNEHENGKVSKAEAGEVKWSKISSNSQKSSSMIQEMSRMVHG